MSELSLLSRVMDSLPKVLILGHSFVKRIKRDLSRCFDPRANQCFDLASSAFIYLHGVGGRTVTQIQSHDLHVISDISPNILILEIGTNDLKCTRPEIIGSAIDDLIAEIKQRFNIRVVCVCTVIPRRHPRSSQPDVQFNDQAVLLNRYLNAVLNDMPGIFTWTHTGLQSLSRPLLLPDGVHLNHKGQYLLYRSYRGAILKAIKVFKSL